MADIFGGAQGAFPADPDLLTRLLQSGALAGLLNPEMDPMAQAAAARDAAGATLSARMGRRTPAAPVPTPFDAAPGALPDAATGGMPFAGLLNATGGFGPAPGLSSVPDLPPSTNDPGASEPTVYKDGVPLPRPRPAMAGLPAAASPAAGPADDPTSAYAAGTTPAAAPAPAPFSMAPAGLAPAAAAPAAPSGIGNIISNIFNPNHAATLLALGAGFSGAGSFGTGMRRAFSNATPAVAADRAYEQKQTGMNATYQALVRKGVPADEAVAAINNPDVLKAVIGKWFEAKPLTVHDVQGPLGDKTPVVFDPNTGKFKDMAGNPYGTGSDAGGIPGASGGGAGSILAPGVKFDPNLSGQAYFDQFSKDVQAIAKARLNGDAIPTGNPRMKSLTSIADTLAKRYAEDMGIPFSDALYAEKRKMRMDLAASGPTSIGGILSNGKSAFGHLANYSDKLAELGSYNGPDIPGGGNIAAGINYVGGKILPTADTKAKITAANDNALKYGQEATKFYSGTGGGVAERMAALHTNDPITTTGKEQAAFLETEKQLMLERLNQKEAQIRQVLGQEELDKHPVMSKDVQDHIARIDANIQRLRGLGGPAAPAAGLPKVATPADAAKLPKGTKFLDPNGVVRMVP